MMHHDYLVPMLPSGKAFAKTSVSASDDIIANAKIYQSFGLHIKDALLTSCASLCIPTLKRGNEKNIDAVRAEIIQLETELTEVKQEMAGHLKELGYAALS
ncbi:MAG: hypothetical protein ACRESZ_06535 [Methylococcales bacterium]